LGTKAALKKSRVGVLMGGLSEEREISMKTGSAVLAALKNAGYNAVGIDADRDVAEVLRKRKIEVAFIALHGRYGEDGSIQGLLEVMGVPYTGSGVRASSVAMDKLFSKRIFKSLNIPTPLWCDYVQGGSVKGVKLPYVVKPGSQGSAIGVSVVRKKSELSRAIKSASEHTSTGVLIEEFIEGREVTVGIIDGAALPTVEVVPKSGLYDYEAKYTKGCTDYLVPAPLAKRVDSRVQSVALMAYNALGVSGAARVDVMLDTALAPYVLEVNTVPGLTELSLLPMAARAAGISYTRLVEKMLRGAGLGKC
jgi:D-alanine-D-alanine ligase